MHPALILSFEGGTVGLSTLVAEDEKMFLELTGASMDFHGPWIQPPITSADFLGLLNRMEDQNFKAFSVWKMQPRTLTGMIHLSQIIHGFFQNAFLSYWIGKSYEGRGWMSEAMRLALHCAFEDLYLHRLEANIQPGNLSSIALVKRLGFVKEGFSEKYLKVDGEWKDHERWAIHREIWPDLQLDADQRPSWK